MNKIIRIVYVIGSILFLFFYGSFQVQGQTTFSGVATYFDGLGTPYGGCGVPTNLVDSDNFVALNVYNSPGVGTMWTRPIRGADTVFMGEFQNGRNCGRWMKVTLAENCIGGINDGALGQAFCRSGGQWQNDLYSGASLYMVVTDACGDNNGWCRDSRYHLDIHRPALSQFQINGTTTSNLFPTFWNNREIKWEYVKAPNYTGDINIYFIQAAQTYWPAIMINHLENGIHWVEQKVGSTWVRVPMNSDMGQSYILNSGPCPYTIRVADVNGNYIQNGREYTFCNPCPSPCVPPTTPVTYTTFNPTVLSIPEVQINYTSQNDNWIVKWQVPETDKQLVYFLEYSSDGTTFHRAESTDLGGKNFETQLSSLKAQFVRLAYIDKDHQKYEGKIQSLSSRSNGQLLKQISTTQWQVGQSNSPVKITLLGISGHLIFNQIFQPTELFTLPTIPEGLYLIHAESNDSYTSQKILMKSQ